jgi:hypothetical protein
MNTEHTILTSDLTSVQRDTIGASSVPYQGMLSRLGSLSRTTAFLATVLCFSSVTSRSARAFQTPTGDIGILIGAATLANNSSPKALVQVAQPFSFVSNPKNGAIKVEVMPSNLDKAPTLEELLAGYKPPSLWEAQKLLESIDGAKLFVPGATPGAAQSGYRVFSATKADVDNGWGTYFVFATPINKDGKAQKNGGPITYFSDHMRSASGTTPSSVRDRARMMITVADGQLNAGLILATQLNGQMLNPDQTDPNLKLAPFCKFMSIGHAKYSVSDSNEVAVEKLSFVQGYRNKAIDAAQGKVATFQRSVVIEFEMVDVETTPGKSKRELRISKFELGEQAAIKGIMEAANPYAVDNCWVGDFVSRVNPSLEDIAQYDLPSGALSTTVKKTLAEQLLTAQNGPLVPHPGCRVALVAPDAISLGKKGAIEVTIPAKGKSFGESEVQFGLTLTAAGLEVRGLSDSKPLATFSIADLYAENPEATVVLVQSLAGSLMANADTVKQAASVIAATQKGIAAAEKARTEAAVAKNDIQAPDTKVEKKEAPRTGSKQD